VGPNGHIELAKALDLATLSQAREERRRLEKRFGEVHRSLAHA
jgi:hypothetical protein